MFFIRLCVCENRPPPENGKSVENKGRKKRGIDSPLMKEEEEEEVSEKTVSCHNGSQWWFLLAFGIRNLKLYVHDLFIDN